MYDYQNTEIRAERLARDKDHCGSNGPVYDLAHLIRTGRVFDPDLRHELTTTNDRRLIYAVNSDLQIHVGFDGERGTEGAVKHETLFHNDSVEAAGEIHVRAGIVVDVNDRSGSYRTTGLMGIDRRMPKAILEAFQRANIPATEAVINFLQAQAGV